MATRRLRVRRRARLFAASTLRDDILARSAAVKNDPTRDPTTSTGGRSVAEWARLQQRAKEDALGPEGRMKLALRLGLRARAMRSKVAP